MRTRKLRNRMREMVAYLLADDADPELIESYTQTFTLIAKQYAKSRSKDRVNIEIVEEYHSGRFINDRIFSVGDTGYIVEFKKPEGKYDKVVAVIDGRLADLCYEDFKVID